MPIAIFITALILTAFYGLNDAYKQKTASLQTKLGNIDGVSRTFVPLKGNFNSQGGLDMKSSSEADSERESIEIALLRACRTASTLAHNNGCTIWNQSSVMWSFLGAINAAGSLDEIYLPLPTATTLAADCSNIADYEAKLFVDAIPKTFVANKNYKYNLTGLDDTNVDPCGYNDIVTR
jgi:hypothetical protein